MKDAAKAYHQKLVDMMCKAQEELDKIDQVDAMSKETIVGKNSCSKTKTTPHGGQKGSKSVAMRASIIDILISPEEAAEVEDDLVSPIPSFTHVMLCTTDQPSQCSHDEALPESLREENDKRMMCDSEDPANLDGDFEPPADFRNQRKHLLAVVENCSQHLSKKQKISKG